MILDTAKGHIILISDDKEVNCNSSPNLWQQQCFGVRLWKTIFNSWFDFPSIFICGEIGACSLSCCDMFTVQNLQQAIIPPHGSSTEIQAPSLSPCHLLIRTIPNMQKTKSVRYKILAD